MKAIKHTLLCGLASMLATALWAQNPIICDRYTPDPAPYVHGDTLYLFVDHDEDVTQNNYFTMKDWLLYSTVDMVNWTYRGTPLTSATFSSWAKQDNDCWASQCIERDGKWYWYVTATIKGQAYPGIGVAVADNPAGPYHDPIKKPLVQGWFKIDPSVFIDDDGQAYLFYGNNMLWYAKLTKSMTAITGGEKEVKTKDEKAFGPYKGYNDDGTPKTNFEEASWIYKRGGKYYLEYATGGVPEHWAYSTADKITGPWTYQGKVMGQAENSFTIHGGSVVYKGHHYMFYHNGQLPGGGGYKRSTCVEEFTPNEDGSLPFITFTAKGVEPLQSVNPFVRQEAETINQSQGVKCEGDYNGCYVTEINSGDYIKVRGVDFGETGATRFTARVRAEKACVLMVRIGAKSGTLKASLSVEPTNGEWQEFSCDLKSPITGKCDLCFTFKTSDASKLDFDSWQFSNPTYKNPVIFADFPDPDVIRVGDTYYMVTTTMVNFPGATIVKSKDLVNWSYCAQPLEQLSTKDRYNLQNGENAYASGMWACSMKYHNGKFHILINGNDAGGFLLTATDPEGKWEKRQLSRSYYDPGMLFDNGKVYVACGIGNIQMCELDEDFNFIQEKRVISNRDGLEGSHLYKIGDYYYIYATYGGWPSGQAVFRSKNIFGPYEEKMLMEKWINGKPNTIHQGALIDVPDKDGTVKEWWTILQQDLGCLGRMPNLQPVTWKDEWPILGNNGIPYDTYTKPDIETSSASEPMPTNDGFRTYPIGMQWQWNHNPDNRTWSLYERPGWLRLKTSETVDRLTQARNMLTQRIFAYYDNPTKESTGTIRLDVSHLQEGDSAGICILQDPYAAIAVEVKDGKKQIVWWQDQLATNNNFTPSQKRVTKEIGDVVYLRAAITYGTSKTQFYYSLDNKTYTKLGDQTTLSFNLSVFVGARFGLFCYQTQAGGEGYADFDWFSTESNFDEDAYYGSSFEDNSDDIPIVNNITVDGKSRSYWLHVPKDCPAGAPLVIAMHGAGGSSNDQSPHFNEIADTAKFIVAYPQGEPIYFPVFGGTVNGWDASGKDNADVAFIKAVIDDVEQKCQIDRNRVYCCGFSNGGMNTYALANACSDIFAACASISGFPLNEFHLRHTGQRPVPFLHIHGKKDDFVKYALMPTIVDEVVARLGANPVPVKTTVSGKYDKSVYEAAEGSFPYVYYEIDDMGHNDFTANTEDGNSSLTMWKFFKQYTLDMPYDATLRWRPRIEEEGYVPQEHGWTMNRVTTLLSFGDQKSDNDQNVYHSLQFTKGTYKLTFRSEGDEGETIGVKIRKLPSGTSVFESSVKVNEPVTLFFKTDAEWSEYKLLLTRKKTANITVKELRIDVSSDEEASGIIEQESPQQYDDSYYSLSGIATPHPSKGIYIKKGKKVVIIPSQ